MARGLKLSRDQLRAICRDDAQAIRQFERLFAVVDALGLPVVRAVSTSSTVADADDVIVATGTITITLPLASQSVGRTLVIKNAGVGTVTVAAAGSDLIDGAATFPMALANESVTVVGAAAGQWVIV
jgi:hypothetical protein